MNATNPERLRELLAAATALPWEADAGTVRPAPESPDRVTIAYCSGEGSVQGEADAELIAAAVNALPALLHQLAELRSQHSRMVAEAAESYARATEAERARDEATGLLRRAMSKIDAYYQDTKGAYPGGEPLQTLATEAAAFLAASGGK